MGLLIEDRARRAETMAAIGEREASLRTLTEQLPAIVYRSALDEVSTTIYVSPAIETLGYSAAEWVGIPDLWLKNVHPDDRDLVLRQLAEDRRSERATSLRYRFRHRDGRWRRIHDVAQLVRSPEGKPLFLQGVMFDVTENEESEARARLRTEALDAAADAIAILDVDGRFLWVNRAFTALTYCQPHEALGRNPRELLKSGRQDDAFYSKMWTDLLAGKVWTGELINRRKDGSEYTEEQTITPVRDDAGAITHFIAIKRDITERKAMELQLSQAQRIEGIGRLAGGVAHDFNNLLTVINGTLEMALPQVPADSELREELQNIRRAADRGTRLTRQLLAFSRQQVLQLEVISLNDVVREVVSLLSRIIGEHIVIRTVLAGDLHSVRADAGQLEQVVMNLSVNARDAMPNGGTLTISTANVQLRDDAARHVSLEPGDYVELSVSDTGIGMDAATRERIFEPFFTTKPAGKGTGLGLPTAHGIVRQSGGSIWVYSEPGVGTVFKLYFPSVADRIVERPSGPSRVVFDDAGTDAGGAETVLVVEDEEAIRRVAVKVLRAKGYHVLEAESGEAALALLEREDQSPDLLLTDMVMPGMTGPELASALRGRAPKLKVLFTSGYSRDAVALQFGMTDGHFIEKPYALGALTRAVRGVLDG